MASSPNIPKCMFACCIASSQLKTISTAEKQEDSDRSALQHPTAVKFLTILSGIEKKTDVHPQHGKRNRTLYLLFVGQIVPPPHFEAGGAWAAEVVQGNRVRCWAGGHLLAWHRPGCRDRPRAERTRRHQIGHLRNTAPPPVNAQTTRLRSRNDNGF
jgi:hypothetical protein